jgi:hypothetical protein
VEKRRARRFQARAPLVCRLFNAHRSYDVTLVNFSEDGICFECDPFLAGDFKEGCIVLIRSNGGNLGYLQAETAPGLRSISLAEIKWQEREEAAAGNGPIKIGAHYY